MRKESISDEENYHVDEMALNAMSSTLFLFEFNVEATVWTVGHFVVEESVVKRRNHNHVIIHVGEGKFLNLF